MNHNFTVEDTVQKPRPQCANYKAAGDFLQAAD